MARFIAITAGSIILGGGIGYGLLCLVSPDESELAKHLPPHSTEKQNLFRLYKKQPELMNKEPSNIHPEIYKLTKNTTTSEK